MRVHPVLMAAGGFRANGLCAWEPLAGAIKLCYGPRFRRAGWDLRQGHRCDRERRHHYRIPTTSRVWPTASLEPAPCVQGQ